MRRSRTSVSSGFSPVSRRACTFQRTRPSIKLTYFLLISLHLYPHEHSALVNSTLIFLCIFGFFVPSLHLAQAALDCCVPCGDTVYIAMLNWNFVDSLDWKTWIHMMTMLGNHFGKEFTTTFAFALIPVVGVLPVHKILEVGFPPFSSCIP